MVKVQAIGVNPVLKPNKGTTFPSKKITLFYQLIQIIYGLDYGFLEYKTDKKSIYIKSLNLIYSLAVGIIFAVLLFHNNNNPVNLYFFFCVYSIIQYLTSVFILFGSKNQLYNCLRQMGIIDCELGVDSAAYNSDVIAFVTVLISVCFRVSFSIFRCIYIDGYCINPAWVNAFFVLLVICHDIIMMTNSFAFYCIHCRLLTLSSKLEIDDQGLSSYLKVYKEIADVTETIKGSFDLQFLATLLFNVPEAMLSIYNTVQKFLNLNLTVTSVSSQMHYAVVFVTLIKTLAPAMLGSKLSTTAHKIKITLHDKWLQEQDPIKTKDIIKFIEYVEARPLIFHVYKVIPLNVHLLGMVLNFCVTYLIVIIQFTNVDHIKK